jgi:hypothetical protein
MKKVIGSATGEIIEINKRSGRVANSAQNKSTS